MEQVEQAVCNCVAAFSQPAAAAHHGQPTKHETHKQGQPTTPTDVREISIVAADSSAHNQPVVPFIY